MRKPAALLLIVAAFVIAPTVTSAEIPLRAATALLQEVPVGDRPPTLGLPRQEEPSAAFGASMVAVAWREQDELFATRMSVDGRSLDGRGVKVGDSFDERVIFDGSQFVLPFVKTPESTDGGRLVVRFLSPESGILPGELPIAESVPSGNFAVAAGRDGVILVWSSLGHVWAASIDRVTRMLIAPPVAVSTLRGVFPSVAWNGTEYLVTFTESARILWHSWSESPKAIRAVRLSGDLLVRDPAPLTISTGTALYSSVASNGEEWLIASDQHLRRLLRNGSTTEAVSFPPMFGEVLWDGANYLGVWRSSTGLNLVTIPAQGPIVLSQPTLVETAAQWCPCPAAPTIHPTPSVTLAGPRSLAFAYTRIANDESSTGIQRAFLRVLTNAPSRRRAVR